MEYARLGNSGLKVSRIALGCMSFGDPDRGFSEWSLREEQAGPFFAQAVELGITSWDTANVYSYGSSEEIVGWAIKTYSRPEDIVLATKMHDGPVHPRGTVRTARTHGVLSGALITRLPRGQYPDRRSANDRRARHLAGCIAKRSASGNGERLIVRHRRGRMLGRVSTPRSRSR